MEATISEIRGILNMPQPYNSISKLPNLTQEAKKEYGKLLEGKRSNVEMLIDQAISEIEEAKQEMKSPSSSVEDSLNFLKQMKDHLGQRKTVTQMDAAVTQINNYKENTLATIKRIVDAQDHQPVEPTPTPEPVPPRKKIETVYRGTICPKKSINSEADIDAYVEGIRGRLKRLLMDSDGLKIE